MMIDYYDDWSLRTWHRKPHPMFIVKVCRVTEARVTRSCVRDAIGRRGHCNFCIISQYSQWCHCNVCINTTCYFLFHFLSPPYFTSWSSIRHCCILLLLHPGSWSVLHSVPETRPHGQSQTSGSGKNLLMKSILKSILMKHTQRFLPLLTWLTGQLLRFFLGKELEIESGNFQPTPARENFKGGKSWGNSGFEESDISIPSIAVLWVWKCSLPKYTQAKLRIKTSVSIDTEEKNKIYKPRHILPLLLWISTPAPQIGKSINLKSRTAQHGIWNS